MNALRVSLHGWSSHLKGFGILAALWLLVAGTAAQAACTPTPEQN
jgi:hypothetical protein